jgi:serine/threonine-protein kinase
MGLVFRARDRAKGQVVAIKALKPELGIEPRAVRCFLREARYMQRLAHPNILPVLEVPDPSGSPYLVMPYIEAGSLAMRLQTGQPLGDDLTLSLAGQIAAAIAYAHSQGIIHHDLKPGNVLVDGEGRAYLTDFGLARAMAGESTGSADPGACVGTAPYMSPAVAAGEAEDTRCDIYSFGALLYEMLTGHPPYTGETASQIVQQILARLPRRIRELKPAAEPGLVVIAEAAMARELRDRYSRMADVVTDLERAAQRLPPLGPALTNQRSERPWSSGWA